MANLHARNRRQERALPSLRAIARRDALDVCEQIGVTPSDKDLAALTTRLVGLSNPWIYSGVDAPIPAQRSDLRRRLTFLLLCGAVSGRAELERWARRNAPAPDGPNPTRPSRYRLGDPPRVTYNQAAAAWRHRRKRLARRLKT